LKENADVVIRLSEKTFEIKSTGHAVEREHYAYTIFSEKGDDYATYETTYDKFNTINSVSAHLYDVSGRELKSFKKKDMQDLPWKMKGRSSATTGIRKEASIAIPIPIPWSLRKKMK
jgi:hypothetical protein